MTPVSQNAFAVVACVLLLLMDEVRGRQVLPSLLGRLHYRLKNTEPHRRPFRVARRSYLDNRINTLPPEPDYFPFHQRENELPYQANTHQRPPPLSPPARDVAFPHKPRHRRPEVDPDFHLDLPDDFLSRDLPSILSHEALPPLALLGKNQPRRPRPHHSSHRPSLLSALDGAGNPDFGDLPESLPPPPPPLSRPLFPSRHVSKHPFLPSLSIPTQPSEDIAGSVGSPKDKDASGGGGNQEEYPALDPFFLSGIDLDNPPSGDHSDGALGDSVLAGFMGPLIPPSSSGKSSHHEGSTNSGLSKLDKETDDVMADFLTFLDLRASGALDKCLGKSRQEAE